MIINHHEIEREITHTLKTISVDNDFVFQPPLEINAKTNGITFGIPVIINFYSDAFYFQIAIGDYKKSEFMQISIRLLIGEITFDGDVLSLLNKLNAKLLYAKVILNEEGDFPYLTLEHDFNAASLEQVNESIYDFLNDLLDDDVSPLMEKILKKMRD
jgi:hypothetical protein